MSPSRSARLADQPLAVEEGAVGREPVVGQHPVPADALELGVQARDLRVVGERDRSHATSRPIVSRPPAGNGWMTCASSRR